jgi:hypothetical protein
MANYGKHHFEAIFRCSCKRVYGVCALRWWCCNRVIAKLSLKVCDPLGVAEAAAGVTPVALAFMYSDGCFFGSAVW